MARSLIGISFASLWQKSSKKYNIFEIYIIVSGILFLY